MYYINYANFMPNYKMLIETLFNRKNKLKLQSCNPRGSNNTNLFQKIHKTQSKKTLQNYNINCNFATLMLCFLTFLVIVDASTPNFSLASFIVLEVSKV